MWYLVSRTWMVWMRMSSPPVGQRTSLLLPPSLPPCSLPRLATAPRSSWRGVSGGQRGKVWGHSSSLLFLRNAIGRRDDGRARSVQNEWYAPDALEGCYWRRGWAGGRWNGASQGRVGRRPASARWSGLSAWWLKKKERQHSYNPPPEDVSVKLRGVHLFSIHASELVCVSLSLTSTICGRQRGFPNRWQGAAVLLNLVHAHRTVPHCVFVVVDCWRAANTAFF